MDTPNWSPDYETRNETVDAQHRQLFAIIHRLHALDDSTQCHERLAAVLHELERYMATHFEAEERLMEEHIYPQLGEHRRLHEELRQDVENLRHTFEGDCALPAQNLAVRLETWLVEHIEQRDKPMIDWVNGV